MTIYCLRINIMNTLRFACKRNIHKIRQFHKCIILQTDIAAVTAASTPSVSDSTSVKNESLASSKVELIADQIVTLNLIEVALLSDVLKKRLNLPDTPIMPMGGFVPTSTAAVEEESEPETVQTSFTVKLKSFDEKQKIALIKEIKNILPDCNLVQAKKFVETAPVIVKSQLTKEEADNLKEVLTKVGGTIEIV